MFQSCGEFTFDRALWDMCCKKRSSYGMFGNVTHFNCTFHLSKSWKSKAKEIFLVIVIYYVCIFCHATINHMQDTSAMQISAQLCWDSFKTMVSRIFSRTDLQKSVCFLFVKTLQTYIHYNFGWQMNFLASLLLCLPCLNNFLMGNIRN